MQRHGGLVTLAMATPVHTAALLGAAAATTLPHSQAMHVPTWAAEVAGAPGTCLGRWAWVARRGGGARGVRGASWCVAGPPPTRCFPCFINLGGLLATPQTCRSLSTAPEACRASAALPQAYILRLDVFTSSASHAGLCSAVGGRRSVAACSKAAAVVAVVCGAGGGSRVIIHLVQTVSLSGIKSGVSVHLFR